MRGLQRIIKDELDIDQLQELAKADHDVEQKKIVIREKLAKIQDAMIALKPFS
jgi:hypothetical protein